jgi:mannose-P-dolichol utilization defect 1
MVKIPQILDVWRARSAEGLSATSFELENIGFSITASYGFLLGLPFTAYGEAAVILFQNTLLLALIYVFSKAPTWRVLVMTALNVSGGLAVTSGVLVAQST